MKNRLLTFLLIIAGLLPIIRLSQDGVSSILIFSIFVLVFLWTGLQRVSAKLPIPLAMQFIGLGIIVGGITQIFVQLEGFEKSFSADPIAHFIQALTIYFWVIMAWYFMLKKYDFSTWDIYWVTGIWGVVFEAILLYGALNPLIWLFIFVVYGSFATIPFLLTQGKFMLIPRIKPNKKNYLAMFGLLVLALVMSNLLIFILSKFGVR
ncbi:MAG: hypothetical protein WC794_01415 [Candidatus Doudnabacteria bacterium]|jgi:hypothetical protein